MSWESEIPASRATDGDPIEKLYKLNDNTSVAELSDGVQAAYVFSPEDWRAGAEAVLSELAQSGHVFTVDDLRREGVSDPDKPQRWGSLFAVMQRHGVIEFAGLQLHRIAAGEVQAIREWRGTASARRRSA